ncbi:MAG: FtsK/SpoIIIE domain-containing protein, partial [Candidatus Omnitrophica bacterium]|nr:FtsK/SpoIIIE domain-containing protein [Candidatus Omnitrophota bacterium]
NAVRFARLEVDIEKFAEVPLLNRPLALPCPASFSVPLFLAYPRQGSILFETTQTGSEEVAGTINNIIYRLLSTTPPGRVNITLIDPVGLGQNFAGLMHLADDAPGYINGRIWTQTPQIEEKLAELNEHMEKVIQMYLRNEFETIVEYNAQAGSIVEKYYLLVIAGFPVNFSETAARRLINIATSGARCGVYTLIHWDQRHTLPQDFVPDELRRNSISIVAAESGLALSGRHLPGTRLVLDPPPPPEVATRFLHAVGQSSKDSNRVEVPFAQVAPPESRVWTMDTTDEVRVPIGQLGAAKLQYLAMGKGTRQHGLIAGKTGSGKSTLFHVIITNLALWCSPEQVEFYLVDFKKGVEFKCYATHRLPHARVVAIESDREFGLSVLQRVDNELRRRGDLFRELGVQDLPAYKKAGGASRVPRCLLIIDEFQEFFVEEDRISQNAAVLLDRIVRQGRAFGIHVLLGSQTLGGAYTLARATLGQMVIRIALHCNEADAYLIMDENNAAPRLLSRPGEGIYNDGAGVLEANSPFQVVWLSDEERDGLLAKIRDRADQNLKASFTPFIFEGNAPAEVRENALLCAALETEPSQAPVSPRIWLGAPNAVKGPTEAVFHRQSGNNLLIVGLREDAVLAILAVALVSLAAQYPRESVRFTLFDSTPPGSRQREFLDRVIQAIPHAILRPKPGDLAAILNGLADELKQRTHQGPATEAPTNFLIIHALENFKKLRVEDDYNFSLGNSESDIPCSTLLARLINEGPNYGLHVIATCDICSNAIRFLGRKTLSEIAMRVLFQMSANDSATLIDSTHASSLGLHRALFYNDQEGILEAFRPYALPDNEWLEQVARNLARHNLQPIIKSQIPHAPGLPDY